MNLRYIYWGVFFLISIHFICYFFNIDLFDWFEKNNNENEQINENIRSLTESLEQLKEITND